jgi:hypothetical protein
MSQCTPCATIIFLIFLIIKKKKKNKLGMVVSTFIPAMQEAEAGSP